MRLSLATSECVLGQSLASDLRVEVMDTGREYESDDSSSGRSTIDIIKSVRVVSYRIASFSVFSIKLKHAVCKVAIISKVRSCPASSGVSQVPKLQELQLPYSGKIWRSF